MLILTHLCANKGKKNVLRTDGRSEDTAEHKVTSQADTKENKPTTNKVCLFLFMLQSFSSRCSKQFFPS